MSAALPELEAATLEGLRALTAMGVDIDGIDPETAATLARLEDERRLEEERERVFAQKVGVAAFEIRARRTAQRIVDAEERPPVEMPAVLTLAQRLALPVDPVVWRVDGWLPAGGRVILAAQAKSGKSSLASNLVRSLVDGLPFLDRAAVAPVAGKVAVFDFELSPAMLDRWYAQLGVTATDRVLLIPMRGHGSAFDLRDDKLRARWAQTLRAHGVAFVVWDCVRPVLDALGLDENHEAGAALTAFDALLAEAGISEALVVHHMGHGQDRARGDSSILGWPDVNWRLTHDGDLAGPRYLDAFGRDVAESEIALSRDPVTGRMSVAGGSRATAKVDRAVDAIRQALADTNEAMTASALEAATAAAGVPRKSLRETLGQMIASGEVTVQSGEKNSRLHTLSASSPLSASELASTPVMPQFASSPLLAAPPADTHSPVCPPPVVGRTGEQPSKREAEREANGEQDHRDGGQDGAVAPRRTSDVPDDGEQP
jgi:hypothetical protein